MPFGAARSWSDRISGRQARELHAADNFAGMIGHPLLYRIHLNWIRTALEDDADGAASATYRARLARWLCHADQSGHALHAIYVRERPPGAAAKPNDHIHLHVPADLVDRFPIAATDLLPRGAFPLGRKAVVVDPIGWTISARDGALVYVLKATAPGAARLIKKTVCSTSVTSLRAASTANAAVSPRPSVEQHGNVIIRLLPEIKPPSPLSPDDATSLKGSVFYSDTPGTSPDALENASYKRDLIALTALAE